MIPQRYAPATSIVARKSRIGEGKLSMLPRRTGSTDRLSTEARRPSTVGSSAESTRPTFTGGRLSRETSATKLPVKRSSRSHQGQGDKLGLPSWTPMRSSQYSARPTTTPLGARSHQGQGDRFGQSSMTPLRSSQYSARPTTTPQRTPSKDRATSWQSSFDRALAFVTVKDTRPISNVAWQRSEMARVQEALATRMTNMALVRPLTIARFVDITGALLTAIMNTKLNSDNYIAKLPHLSKRLLYPGTVSKSWLKTVNTLHAFPHALALIAYLLDFVNHIEMPICCTLLYIEKDELSCVRRQYLDQCWIRFQTPEPQLDDLREEYLLTMKRLLGNHEEKIPELNQVIKEYENRLEDETDHETIAEEKRLLERKEALVNGLRAERGARRGVHVERDEGRARETELAQLLVVMDEHIELTNAESQQLSRELESQSMSVVERTKLCDDVLYAGRVCDSKRALAEQLSKMVRNKEIELALCQKKSLDSCMQYKQGLIRHSAQFPQLSALVIDENELMEAECALRVSRAVDALRECSGTLAASRSALARSRTALARRQASLLDESRTKIIEVKAAIEREQQALEALRRREANEAAQYAKELQETCEKLEAVQADLSSLENIEQDLEFWEKQDLSWRSKLASMYSYIESVRAECGRRLAERAARRGQRLAALLHRLDVNFVE